MTSKERIWAPLMFLIFAILQIGSGIWLLTQNNNTVGINRLTRTFTAFGGEFYILGGLFFLVLAYFTLSPFSKLRTMRGKKPQKTDSKTDKSHS